MMKLRGLLLGVILVSSSCVSGGIPSIGLAFVPGGLRSFGDCGDFLEYVKRHAIEHVTPWGLPGGTWWDAVPQGAEFVSESGAALSAASAGPPEHSTTNVQTPGVDEPDIVKTDGRRLLALARGRLFLVDLAREDPVVRGSVNLGDLSIRDMLLLGDRALLMGEVGTGAIPGPLAGHFPSMGYERQIAVLVEVDLSDAEHPRITRRMTLDGRYLSARMTDGAVRVVMSSIPTGLRFVTPEGGGLRGEREAVRRNREVIRDSTLESWVPYFVLDGGDGRALAEGPLLDCASARHPEEFAGFGMLTVLTLDPSEPLSETAAERSVGVLADGETVYASAGSLYVATQRWFDWELLEGGRRGEAEEGHVTQIHRFETSGSDPAVYRSSGRVPGWLLNQFSMDEHRGFLRVASTDAPPFWDGPSESMVTVLQERGLRLAPVGRVDGLGRDERIYAVRFLGDRGYVVTFREVDPLYVLDLSEPTSPAVSGELKILGYSAYLHPLEEGLLLGVGQDATRRGTLKGTQLSVFDVSDPAEPRRIDQVRVTDGESEVEWDHHAFLHWKPEGLIVLPVNAYRLEGSGEGPFVGAMALRFRDGALRESGRLQHQRDDDLDFGGGIRRSVVAGDRLYTVSEGGVEAADLTTLEEVAWTPFR